MKTLLIRALTWVRLKVWALIIAYMLGLHNFWYGDSKSQDNISKAVEMKERDREGQSVDEN